MNSKKSLLVFILLLIQLLLPSPTKAYQDRPIEYLVTTAAAKKLVPIEKEKNFSGLTYVPHTRSYFAIINKGNILFEFDDSFNLKRKITLIGFDDPEDLIFVGMTINGPMFAIAEETGSILIGLIGGGASLTASSLKRIGLFDESGRELRFDDNKGFEGITYLPQEEKFVVVKEKKPIKVWSFSLSSALRFNQLRVQNYLTPETENMINSLVTDLSAVGYNKKYNSIVFLSDESSRMITVDKMSQTITKVVDIQTKLQHEALSFSADDETIFVGSEPYYLLIVDKSNTIQRRSF